MQKTWKCIRCEESFQSGKWLGCNGDQTQAHEVTPKTYFSHSDGLTVHVRPERKMTDNSGNLVFLAGIFAEFRNGQYATASPEIQEVLDTKDYLISKEVYVDSRLTEKQKLGRQVAKVEEQRQLIAKQQQELENLRAQKDKRKDAAA